MRRNKECDCNRSSSNYKSVEFEINNSILEMKCTICDGLIGWWDSPRKKVKPIKRKWFEEECLTMR